MRTVRIKLEQLEYQDKPIGQSLIESLARQGQTFPLKVKQLPNGNYFVLDGNKRVSYFKQFHPNSLLTCDVINDFTTAGSNYWGEKNHH